MNLADIQGLVFHSYRRLPYATYVLLRFQHRPAAARGWLAGLVEGQRIDCARPKDTGPAGSPDVRLNVAFTRSGLQALGLCRDALKTFPLEFLEGLGVPWRGDDEPDHRSRMLGDVGESRPDQWDWGYQADARSVDALLLAFGRDPIALQDRVRGWIRDAEELGAIAPRSDVTLWGQFPEDLNQPNREPFGFVDGISQPILRGATPSLGGHGRPRQPAIQEIDDGEMLLGHRDATRMRSASPTVPSACDPDDILPSAFDVAGRRDLGFNGTYLVFRQLAQQVDAFNSACRDAAQATGLTPDHVGALLVGRWKDGSPLISAPIAHEPTLSAPPAANDFGYAHDPHGERCPLGAHIRRANPRDGLDDGPRESLRVTNRHRILRRGRPYEHQSECGLHFIALNASISRQFEFIQQNWINDPTFRGLPREDDPLIGARQGAAQRGQVTLPPPPEHRVARRVAGLQRFVTVKGGGYFFLPSLTALRYLAQARPAPARPKPWRAAAPPPTEVDRVRVLALSRFHVLFALLLAASPLAILAPGASLIVRPAFDLDRLREMGLVAMSASLTAAGFQLAFRVLQLYAPLRFGVRIGASTLTWRTVFLWQALSLPAVGTAWWRSAHDAGSSAWELVRYGGAAAAGYVAALAVLAIAAAVRAANVLPDHAAGAVLLPLTHTARREDPPPLLTRLLAPVTRAVESRAAMLPPVVGAGYVDPETGRILPGHLTTLAFVATLMFLYLVGWLALGPPTRLQLPPLAYFLFVLLVAGLVTCGAAFFFDKFRVPLLTLILSWLVAAAVFGGTDHEFPVRSRADWVDPPGIPDAIARADARYPWPGDSADRPLVVVAAAGGGIRQAGWTARVLTGLTELYGPVFSENLRLVSAVSGGSVGALSFLGAYGDSAPSPTGSLLPLVCAAETAASSDIWWGLVYADAPRTIIPYPPRFPKTWFPRTLDRGWALEQVWQRSMTPGGGLPPTLASWSRDVRNGVRPAVAFNATAVETGERAVLATYDVPKASGSSKTLDAADVTNRHDLSLFTAVRLSATFPFVTPVARLEEAAREHAPNPAEMQRHFADGGYWDNTGLFSALEWLKAAGVIGTRRVVVIQIAPAAIGETVVRDRSWVWQWTAPLSTLLAVRTNAQQARNAIDVDAAKAVVKSVQDAIRSRADGRETALDTWRREILFVTIQDPGTRDATLGWHLSREEKADIDRQWRNATRTDREFYEIANFLEKPMAAASDSSSARCTP